MTSICEYQEHIEDDGMLRINIQHRLERIELVMSFVTAQRSEVAPVASRAQLSDFIGKVK